MTRALIDRARYLATQARQPAAHYEHTDAGFNYRLSNVLAAIGRGQLERLPSMMQRRAEIYRRYEDALGVLPGIDFMPFPRTANRIGGSRSPQSIHPRREPIEKRSVSPSKPEHRGRPAWKPMHLQPLFADAESVGGCVSDAIFESASVCRLVLLWPMRRSTV